MINFLKTAPLLAFAGFIALANSIIAEESEIRCVDKSESALEIGHGFENRFTWSQGAEEHGKENAKQRLAQYQKGDVPVILKDFLGAPIGVIEVVSYKESGIKDKSQTFERAEQRIRSALSSTVIKPNGSGHHLMLTPLWAESASTRIKAWIVFDTDNTTRGRLEIGPPGYVFFQDVHGTSWWYRNPEDTE